MTDWGQSNRHVEYSYKLVDPFTLEETGGELSVVRGSGEVTWALDSDTLAGAKLTVDGACGRDALVRIGCTVRAGTDRDSRVLGTFFVADEPRRALHGEVQRSVSLYSTLLRHTGDTLIRDFACTLGRSVVAEIRQIVEADGGRLRVLPGVVDVAHTRAPVIPMGTGKAKALSTLAGWIGCTVGVDELGRVTLGPDVDPAGVAPAYTFEAGANCTYVPGVDASDTAADAVNRVHAWYSLKESTGNVTVDLPAAHPFSYQRIGRHVTYEMKLTEEKSADELRAEALSYLNSHCGGTEYFEVEHVYVPGVRLGDTVRYVNDSDFGRHVDVLCQVDQMTMKLGPAGLCDTKLRVVG